MQIPLNPPDALLTWAYATKRAAERMMRLGSGTLLILVYAEAATAVLALRNVLRAMSWFEQGSQRAQTRLAIEQFHRRVPDLVKLRNILEHFDDYATGTGALQLKAAKAGQSVQAYPVSLHYTQGDGWSLTVGTYSVRFADAYRACDDLVVYMMAGFLRDDDEPGLDLTEPGVLDCDGHW